MREETTLKKRSSHKFDAGFLKHPAIAFFATAVFFVIMLVISQKYPFGKYETLISDLEAQYAPYLFLLKAKLADLNFARFTSDFGYSFLLGAGRNFASTFGYYLASPLNLLVIFFDASQSNEFVMLLMCLKLSFASAFMCMFIEERAAKKGTLWPILWGIMYAFSSYTMLFLFHIMWLDGYMLLPLLLFMIERYLVNGKLGGVTAVLFFLFLSNYYIAYMAGIYSFIYLLSRLYLLGRFTRKEAPRIIVRFVLRAVLTGLTLCILLLPVGLDTIRNGDPTHSSDSAQYVGFTFTKFLDRIFLCYPGDFNDILICNMPLIFVSLLVTVLCTVFFVSRAFSGKTKRFYAAAFILIYLTFCIDFLDVAWQVFDSPNWFWHREAFVFITFFLTVSYQVFENIHKVTNADLLKAGGVLGVLLLAAQSFGDMRNYGKVFIFNLAIIAVVLLLLAGLKKTDWSGQLKDMDKIIPVLIAVFTIYEVAFLAPMQSAGTATLSLSGGNGENFVSNMLLMEDYAEASDILDLGFRSDYETFRIEDDIGIGGTAQYTDYRPITIFNSNSNKAFGRFLKQLGYAVNYNYFSADYSYAAPATDAFFSIGTMYSTDSSYSGADLLVENEEMSCYTSRSVLPLVFTASSGARDFDFYSLETDVNFKDYFAFQNDWYRSLFGAFTEDFFVAVDPSCITEELLNGSAININDYLAESESTDEEDADSSAAFDPDDIGLEVVSDYFETQTDIYRTNAKLPIILNYDIEVTSPDELYMNISVPRMNGGCQVYADGVLVTDYSENTIYSTIIRIGSFAVGDTVRVTIMADHDSWTYTSVKFAYFDIEAFESQFASIDTSATTINEADDGYVSFTASVKAGEMILTSIPYEDGWTLTVDGREATIVPYQDALISIDCEPGTHDIVLRFTPPGLKSGACLSVVGIIGLVAVSLLDRKKGAH